MCHAGGWKAEYRLVSRRASPVAAARRRRAALRQAEGEPTNARTLAAASRAAARILQVWT
ncbi:hypothetical protein BVIET440_20123 [Burkholderia vietnamiensis]